MENNPLVCLSVRQISSSEDMTFLLRNCIADQEQAAYHNGRGPSNLVDLKLRYNQLEKDEVYMKFNIYKHLGRLGFLKDVFAY